MQLSRSRLLSSLPLLLLIAFMVVVFVTGGSSRTDVLSLVFLRPFAALVCAVALASLPSDRLREYRLLFLLFGSLALLIALHLVPLPPSLWRSLPGRELLAEIDRTVGIVDAWRPLTLEPAATWDALFGLLVPFAALLLAVQLTVRDGIRLMYLLVALGCASSLLGLFQLAGPPDGPLYLYAVTNDGAAVGLFANRNHTAVFLACLFPILAYLVSIATPNPNRARFTRIAAVATGVFLFAMILLSGSRAGTLASVLGIALAFAIFHARSPRPKGYHQWLDRRVLAGLGAIGGVALLFAFFARANALNRLFADDQLNDLRFRVWGAIAELGWSYFPAGSGIGSFVPVYQVVEAHDVLRPDYLNHAHNDWLELFLTGGLPAMSLIAVAILFSLRHARRAWFGRDANTAMAAQARVGSVILLIFALASIADYPLRTPSLAAFAVLAAVWLHRSMADGNAIRVEFG